MNRQRLRTWAIFLGWWWSDVRLLFARTFQEFVDDHCLDIAAGLSYYVLFSIFPLAILAVSVTGVLLKDEALRGQVTHHLLTALPLLPGAGRRELQQIIEGVVQGSAVSGVAGLLGLAWSASAMMGALRYAIGEAWDAPERRPFLRGKLVDVLMLAGLGGLLTVSVGATVFIRVARRVSERASEALGPVGAGAHLGFQVVAVTVPLALSFVTFLLVYKVIPNVRTRVRDIWPGALFAAVLFEIAKTAFAVYLRYFGNYDRVYGSLGAVVAFLFFVYIGASVLLLGAEMASEWPRVVHGMYDEHPEGAAGREDTALRRRVLSALSGLVRSNDVSAREQLDPAAKAARGRRRARVLARDRADSRKSQGGTSGPPARVDGGEVPERDARKAATNAARDVDSTLRSAEGAGREAEPAHPGARAGRGRGDGDEERAARAKPADPVRWPRANAPVGVEVRAAR